MANGSQVSIVDLLVTMRANSPSCYCCEDAASEIERLMAALQAAKISHYECEDDPFYSCCATDSYQDCHGEIRRTPRKCTCGADEHNAKIDTVLSVSNEKP